MSRSNPRSTPSPICARGGATPLPLLENLEQRLLLTTVSLALSTNEITESGGTPAVFTVSRDNTVGDLTVNYRVGGSEPVGKIAQNLTGTLVIPAGSTSATISATPINDGLAGYNNTLTIALLAPDGGGYSLGTASQGLVSQGTVRIDESNSLLGNYITVGPGKMYADPWTAMAHLTDGTTMDIFALPSGQHYTMPTGTDHSVGTVNYNNVTIRGIGEGRAKVFADPTTQLENQKGIIVFQSNKSNFTVENLDLEGARYGTPGKGNGAGLRGQGDNYTVRNCYFANNEDGILSDGSGASNILIEYSEFYNNGAGDGQSHNLYIGTGANVLTFQYNYDDGASVGHLLKSRAKTSYVLYNNFHGCLSESYEVSFPDAGKVYVIGNVIRQAPTSGNGIIVDYASETAPRVGDFFYVVNNTIVNDRGGGTFIQGSLIPTGFNITIEDNILAGSGTPWVLGQGLIPPQTVVPTTAGNVINSISALKFVNPTIGVYDYHLLSNSPAIGAGVDPGTSSAGYSLAPTKQYVRENGVKSRPTGSPWDAGAYDYLSNVVLPTVTGVAVNNTLLGDSSLGRDAFTVTVTFSEAMKASSAPTIVFTPAVAGSLALDAGAWMDATHYTAWYNVTDANVEVMNIGIGVTGAQDAAGNTQTAYSAGNQFNIDTLAPTVSASVDHVAITLTATDNGSGVVAVGYQVNGGSWLPYAGPFSVQAGDTVSYDATDAADNWASHSLTVPLAGGDANKDGYVNVVDLGVLARYYDTVSGATWAMGDFNNDGAVNVVDLGVLAKYYDYGAPGGPTGESAASASSGTVSALAAPVQPVALLAPAAAPVATTTTPLSAAAMDVASALDSVPAIGTVKGKQGVRVRRFQGQVARPSSVFSL